MTGLRLPADKRLRAITLWQPWAWAMSIGLKTVENRAWAPPQWLIGRDIALHAGMRFDPESDWMLHRRVAAHDPAVPWRHQLIYGAVTAIARMVRVIYDPSTLPTSDVRWFLGPVGWVVDDVRTLAEPVSCRGYQRLWRVPGNVQSQIEAQLKERP